MTIDKHKIQWPSSVSIPEWANDARMGYLFSSFPPERTSRNAIAYDEKLQFWSKLIHEGTSLGRLSSSESSKLSFDEPALHLAFKRGSALPLCLGTVLAHLESHGAIINRDDFAKRFNSTARDSLFSASGLLNLVLAPPRYLLSSLFGGLSSSSSSESRAQEYINIHLLSQEWIRIQRTVLSWQNTTDFVLDWDQFKATCGFDSEKDTWLMLIYLVSERHVSCQFSNESSFTLFHERPHLIKFHPLTAKSSIPNVITETDKGILSLKTSHTNLTQQIQQLENLVSNSTVEAKKCVQGKLRNRALMHLRQKKTFEELLKKRYMNLDTVDGILLKIQNTETEADLMQAYQAGTDVLKTLLAKPELSIENVENTMDKLADIMADQKSIEDAVQMGQDLIVTESGSMVDMDEISRDLDALLEEDKENAVQSALTSAPDVPQTCLNVPDQKEKSRDGKIEDRPQPLFA